MIIDFHNHYFPQNYLDLLEHGRSAVWVERDESGQLVLCSKGFRNDLAYAHYNLEARVEAMEAHGVDHSCLTFTIPGVHVEPGDGGIRHAQIVNDSFAAAIQAYPGRFSGLAVLPLHDPAAAVIELRRAVAQLGLSGGTLYSHINGQPLDDASYYPVYEAAIELDVPLWMHPTMPQHVGAMADFGIVVVAGFLHETTVAVLRLLYSGTLQRYASLQLVLSQMGGTIPFLAERAERGYHVYPHQIRLDSSPREQLRRLWADTTPMTPKAIEIAVDFFGADKVLLGTDFPHTIGDLAGGLETIRQLSLSEEIKARILGLNAKSLLKL